MKELVIKGTTIMKTTLLALVIVSTSFSAHAGLFGRIDKYVIKGTSSIVEIAASDIENGQGTYINNKGRKTTIDMSLVSIATNKRIDGIQEGDSVLATTNVRFSDGQLTTRYCTVFNIFENRQAHIGCKTIKADTDPKEIRPELALPIQLNYVVNDISSLVPSVSALDGYNLDDRANLIHDADFLKANTEVEILRIYSDGHALVKKASFVAKKVTQKIRKYNLDIFTPEMDIHKHDVELVNLANLRKN